MMYIDESGDCGLQGSPTQYFVLTGLVIHELRWRTYLNQLIEFRRRMKGKFGLPVRAEIHASAMLTKPKELVFIKRQYRLAIIRAFADELATMTDLAAINIVVDKREKAVTFDVFTTAWTALIQRFENTLSNRNFRGPTNPDERGVLFPDYTDNKKLTELLRRIRHFNPIPNQPQFGPGYRDLPVGKVIEDPSFRRSHESYFIQAADLVAFLLYQSLSPNRYMRTKSGQNYFNRLEPILCKVASSSDPNGVVRL